VAIERRDDWITDAQGRALAGALVYYCSPQPANTGSVPPSPLATVYLSTSGIVGANPQISDGFGHVVAYLDDTVYYTIVYSHPLFGATPVILPDQLIVGPPGGGGSISTFEGIPSGSLDGTNRVFTITNGGTPIPNIAPTQITAWVNFPLINGVGFVVAGNQITFTVAPHIGDNLYAQGIL
jgi:hypothetical protein